ncbi:hypothetical protein [Kineosporia babensis]|uniref:Uncharacterized protein n=1 Tax=Kineosporia babensis TaxID=499548 RepID=A0A9X1NB90_9ACTN|nr:hypothetical protein [Kineosporia babensis]MCD5310925.1 hypothetical protein [Kineosporia babensis]
MSTVATVDGRPVLVDTCETCGAPVSWIPCPFGGWWAHDDHPGDEHTVTGPPSPEEWMDDCGFLHTALIEPEETS